MCNCAYMNNAMENDLTMKMDPIARCCIRTDVQYVIMMVVMMKSIAV